MTAILKVLRATNAKEKTMTTNDATALRRQARRLMSRYAYKTDDPVFEADRRTSMNDARIGLCLALGVPMEYVDPASGHDYSDEAYESVRDSWRNYAQRHGFSWFYDQGAYERIIDGWRERRPDLVIDEWILEEWKRY